MSIIRRHQTGSIDANAFNYTESRLQLPDLLSLSSGKQLVRFRSDDLQKIKPPLYDKRRLDSIAMEKVSHKKMKTVISFPDVKNVKKEANGAYEGHTISQEDI